MAYKIPLANRQGEIIEICAIKDNIKIDFKQVRHDVVVPKSRAQNIEFVSCLCECGNESYTSYTCFGS